MLRRVNVTGWLLWPVLIVSVAVYVAALYLSQRFSTNDEFGLEVFVGGFALVAAGVIVIDGACKWRHTSDRRRAYYAILTGILTIAAGLALPWALPRHVYHQRWTFAAFSLFFGGWYVLIYGCMWLNAVRKSTPRP